MSTSYVNKIAAERRLPIIDAKKYTVIVVTSSDVVEARKKNSKHCAIARAALRLPTVTGAHIFRSTAFLETRDGIVRYKIPGSLQKEIVSFDRAGIFAPGKYHLAAMPPALTQESRNRRKVKRRASAPQPVRTGKLARTGDVARAIAKVAAADPPNPTPEQRQFDAKVGALLAAADRPSRARPNRARWVRGTEEPR